MARESKFQWKLDGGSGVPAYRQIMDQILAGVATGSLVPGDQLPTVRQLAVDCSVNPNTVVRAYRELELRGVLSSQQGVGSFIRSQPVQTDEEARQRRLVQLAADCAARAGAEGFSLSELIERLRDLG